MKMQIENGVLRKCTLESGENAVVIPDEVRCIGKIAFCGCDSHESVVIPEGVHTLGKSAFY